MSTTENSPHNVTPAAANSWKCGLCPSPKPAPWCVGCAKETGCREAPNHFVDGRLGAPADLIVVAESPVVPRIGSIDRIHVPYQDDGGQLILRAIEALRKENERFAALQVAKTYAVLCTSNQGDKEASKSVIDRCRTFLHTGIQRATSANKTPVIVAMGMAAVKALGIKAGSLKEVQSRVLPGVQIGDKLYTVVVTISSKQLIAMAGVYNTFYGDMRRAFSIAAEGGVAPALVPLEQLTRDYIIPATVDEVREICDHILRYSENGKPPDAWSISADTETNTLFPHRDGLKVLCVSFAWATGKACAIPLWHKESPYDPKLAAPFVQTVLASRKPKCFHNCLTGDSLVTLADGDRRRLDDLVREKYAGQVVTVNETTGQLEPKTVIGWVKAPRRRWEEWRRIEVRGKGVLRLTEDHVVITPRGRIPAGQLKPGDQILRGQAALNEAQTALIYGSLAGDASLSLQKNAASRSPYFVVSHSQAQDAYARLKAQTLGQYLKNISVVPNQRGFSAHTEGTLTRVRSKSDAIFNEVRDTCYVDVDKKMTEAWWRRMTPAALAIWYCDDGTLVSGRTSAAICVSAIGGDIAVQGLQRMGFPAKLRTRADGHTYLYVAGPQGRGMCEGLRRFWETIAPYVPVCMAYKLPERFRHLASDAYWTADYPATAAIDTVIRVSPLLRPDGDMRRYSGYEHSHPIGPEQYCLTVEDNANFIASGLAVSNCKYDLKVFRKLGWEVNNYVWDTMLAEHALEEDKKGQYGLKELSRVFFSEFASYADNLHEMLEKEVGDSQLENIRKAQKDEAQADAEALASHGKKKGGKKKQGGGFENIPLATLLPYAAIDTDVTRRLSILQMKRILAEQQEYNAQRALQARDRTRRFPIPQLTKEDMPVRSVVLRTAVPASRELADMEFQGVRVDRGHLEQLMTKLDTQIAKSAQELYTMAEKTPETLKLDHAKSIANILFSEGYIHPDTRVRTYYPPVSFTTKGQMQTTEKVLKFLVAKHKCPFSAKKLIYSKAVKARNTFCQNVWDLSSLDGYLHTNYNLHGTSTGRLSSNDENMQNIPKKLAECNIKKTFIPDDDSYVIVNADAKNAEVRIFTAYSGDEALAASINAGEDTHCFFASKIVDEVRRTSDDPAAVLRSMGLTDKHGGDSYPLTYEDFAAREKFKESATEERQYYGNLLDKFRTAVKRVVFGILYGAGAKKIAETIGISEEQAQAIIDMLFRLFPSIPGYMDRTRWELRTFGCVETYFGRRRRFAVKGATGYLRSRAERQGVNFKIQSTSSDIVMDCLIRSGPLLRNDLRGRLLITVHDSLVFQLPKKYLSQLPDFVAQHLLIKAGTKYPWLPVDFKWDYEVGPSYGELMSLSAYNQNLTTQEITNEASEAYSDEEVYAELASDEA